MQNRFMPKQTVRSGNQMMIEKILQMPVQQYQEHQAVYRVVEIAGRKTGQQRRVPLAVFQQEGQRYFIAPSRGRDWVHNLIAAGACILVTAEEQEQSHVTLTFDDKAIQAVQAYMAQLQEWALQQFPFPATASAEEMLAKREEFAIFRLS